MWSSAKKMQANPIKMHLRNRNIKVLRLAVIEVIPIPGWCTLSYLPQNVSLP